MVRYLIIIQTKNNSIGDLSVAKRLDYETLNSSRHYFDLTLVAGIKPYTTTAIVKVELIDVDDNAPKIQLLSDDRV
jgi:hypothetical protein